MATKKSPKTATVGSKAPAKAKKVASPQAKSSTPTAKKATAPKTPTAANKKKTAKATSSKISHLSFLVKKPLKAPEISHEAISLRAYFIAERRHKMGWPGNSTTDWDDAVNQLKAEALERPLKKR